MANPLTPTELRANLYNVLDEVVETGVPQEIKRGDRTLLIIPAAPTMRKLGDLPKRDVLACTVDELVETAWEYEAEPES